MPKYFSYANGYLETHDNRDDAELQMRRECDEEGADPEENPSYFGVITHELISYGFAPAVEGAEFDYWRQLRPGAPGEVVTEPHDLFDWALIAEWAGYMHDEYDPQPRMDVHHALSRLDSGERTNALGAEFMRLGCRSVPEELLRNLAAAEREVVKSRKRPV